MSKKTITYEKAVCHNVLKKSLFSKSFPPSHFCFRKFVSVWRKFPYSHLIPVWMQLLYSRTMAWSLLPKPGKQMGLPCFFKENLSEWSDLVSFDLCFTKQKRNLKKITFGCLPVYAFYICHSSTACLEMIKESLIKK